MDQQRTRPSESITIFNAVISSVGLLGSFALLFTSGIIIGFIGLVTVGITYWVVSLITAVVKTGERREEYLEMICSHLVENGKPSDAPIWQDV